MAHRVIPQQTHYVCRSTRCLELQNELLPDKLLALTQQEPERQFLQERIRQLK